MQCTRCGFMMEPWDTSCPKCARAGTISQAGGYTPPQSSPVNDQTQARIQWMKTFKPAGALKIILLGLFCAYCLLMLASILTTIGQNSLIQGLTSGTTSQTQLEASDVRTGMLALIQLGLFIGLALFWCLWKYRMHKNLDALGSHNTNFSHGWAVGWYFVPFLNLARPYQVMQEIWFESGGLPSPIVGGWWAMLIVDNVITRVSTSMATAAQRGQDISAYITAGNAQIAAHLASLVAAVLAMLVVHKVSQMQQEKLTVLWNQAHSTLKS